MLTKDYRRAQHSVDFAPPRRHMAAIEAHSSVNWR
jgi:hypothetical protein